MNRSIYKTLVWLIVVYTCVEKDKKKKGKYCFGIFKISGFIFVFTQFVFCVRIYPWTNVFRKSGPYTVCVFARNLVMIYYARGFRRLNNK